MNETPFKLSYILASCMYGTMPLVEIVSEVPKIGSQHIDIWPRVHATTVGRRVPGGSVSTSCS